MLASTIALLAAAALAAAALFSATYGNLAVAVGLASVPVALLFAPWLRARLTIASDPATDRRPGDARFAAPQTDGHYTPDSLPIALAAALWMVAASVGWRLAERVSFEDASPLLIAGLVGGALLSVWALAVRLCGRGGLIPAFAGFALASAAATGWIDVGLDAAPPVRAQVAVLRRDIAVPEPLALHRLELGVGATLTDWRRVAVSPEDRQHLFLGSTACLEEHAGRLGLAWAVVHPCPADGALTGAIAAHRWIAHFQRPVDQWLPLARELAEGGWRDVDRQLSDLQRRFEAGEVTDVDIDQAFNAFYNASPSLDAPLLDWLAKAPHSDAAHIAAAQHARQQFEILARGGFTADVSPGFDAEGQRASALRHLDAADSFGRKASVSTILRYRVSPIIRADMDGWLDRAVAANPDDVLMRREYLNWHRICPCGGRVPDDPAMRRVLAGPVSPKVREAMTAWRLFERASDLDGTDQAAELYRQVLELHAHPQEAYMADINLAVYLMTRKQDAAALERLDDAIAILPGNVHAHDVRGQAHEKLGQNPQALADYLIDARRDDIDAQHQAGRVLLWGRPGVPRDTAQAARWIAAASYLGEAEARSILRGRPDLLASLGQHPAPALAEGADTP